MLLIRFHRSPGFSLLEMMIAFSIIAIFLTLALPKLDYFFKTTQANILQTSLIHEIAYAQQTARAYRLPIGLCASTNQKNCSIDWQVGQLIFIDTEENGQVTHPEQIISVIKNSYWQGELHFRSYPYYRHYLLFVPFNWKSQDNGTFWYCLHKNTSPSWAIILSQSGRTRVKWPDQDGNIHDGQGKILVC